MRWPVHSWHRWVSFWWSSLFFIITRSIFK
jgi:hypothetical protein